MTRLPNKFIDPITSTVYEWALNHDEEQEFGQERQINTEANTSNLGLVRVQGARTPMSLKLSGKMLSHVQRDEFWSWFALCETQTIQYQDVEENLFEVLITAYNPIRVRVVSNSRTPTQPWYYSYTLTMDVIRVISGPLAAPISGAVGV